MITILRQKISDAEQAGVREVPLSNLRRLIDQIEQDKIDSVCGTRSGNGQSKSNTGSMNKKQKILTVVALLVFIALGAFHYLTVTHFYYLTPNRGLPLLGISDPSHAIVSDVKTPWFMLGVIYAALFFLLQNKGGGR
ncbi:MAG: hypothetical protein DMF37_10090 [Verrucomicrobia bacterium]|nr:MAG: hypothetical protein DMF37_10090 [Verrucomicrobiota bacterium]